MIFIGCVANVDPVVFGGTTHGVTDLYFDMGGLLSCGFGVLDTFDCPNCGRRMCWCAGHDACALCDQCCGREECS